ncbi:MAG TPA: hypothetical protein VK483_02690 [Chitinophagaceae bacterium]|nr:hypothetical protein [Chitinophagaceae bacterium]
MKNRIIYGLMIMICCIGLPLITFAQGPPDPEDVPIDGGLCVLLAAGVGYGIKKYRDSKKNQDEESQELK